MEEPEIRALVTRLSRPHASGGVVIESAAILAAGADSPAVMEWIMDHSGAPDTTEYATRSGGLHGGRIADGSSPASQKPRRFVFPAGALL